MKPLLAVIPVLLWGGCAWGQTINPFGSNPNTASLGANGPAYPITVGTPYVKGQARSIQFNCTTGGTVTFTESGTSVQWIISAGTTEIAHASTIVTSIGSAVCPQIYAHY